MADTECVDPDTAREFAKEVEKLRSISTSTPVAVKILSSSCFSEPDSGFEDTTADSCFSTSTTTSCENYSFSTDSDSSFHCRPASGGLFYSPILKEQPSHKQPSKEHSLRDWEIADDESVYQKINKRNFTDFPCRNLNFDIDDNDSGVQVHSSPTITSELESRFQEVLQTFSPPVLDHLIGRKMGLEHVDIISELSKKNVPCVSTILSYLEPKDLCSICLVSQKWKTFVDIDKTACNRHSKFLEKSQAGLMGKENSIKSSNSRSRRGLTDANKFCSIQLTQCQRSSTPYSKVTSQEIFTMAADSLREGESLRHCPKCFGASRVLPGYERGTCFNEKCKFDFCVKCFCKYHGARLCNPIETKKQKKDVIGSKKAKKNLKRLSAL